MNIGGFQKFSLIDFEGKTCSIVFTQGCNFRCPFCHNPELVLPELFSEKIPFEEILIFLKRRRGLIDAVEFTGGEPLLQKDLKEGIAKLKEMGFIVKLDTNGSFPVELGELVQIVDYFAMDIKAPIEEYQQIVNVPLDSSKILESIKIIMNSGKDYEFRTTLIKGFHNKDRIERMASLISNARRYILQRPRFTKLVDPGFSLRENFTDDELEELKKISLNYAREVIIR